MSLHEPEGRADQRAIVVVWAVLVLASCASWVLGVRETGTPGGIHPVKAVLLVIAMTKVRFVGAHFMELRGAPRPLRLLFELWVVGSAVVLCGLYLLTS